MKLIWRLFFGILGLALLVAGSWAAAVGHSRSNGNYMLKARYETPLPHAARALTRETRDMVSKLPAQYRAHLDLENKGMLYPLGGGGALLAFVGAIMLLNGIFRAREKVDKGKVKAADETRVMDEVIAESVHDSGGAKFSIDENLMDVVTDEDEELRDINHLVTLRQSDMQPELIPRIVRMFRPDLEKFLPMFNSEGEEKLAYQILESVILRHHRRSKDITADQFHAQDSRIIECERKAFCHRYMPPQHKIVSAEHREFLGKVYDPYTRSAIQKKVAGEADDWMDVSLRSAAEVLAAKTALEEPAESAAGSSQTPSY